MKLLVENEGKHKNKEKFFNHSMKRKQKLKELAAALAYSLHPLYRDIAFLPLLIETFRSLNLLQSSKVSL